MAAVGTPTQLGSQVIYSGVAGVNDDDIVIETGDVLLYDAFLLSNAAGAVDVEVNDGTRWLTAGVHTVTDLGVVPRAEVAKTVALKPYSFSGRFYKIRIRQNGATAATDAVLMCAFSHR